MFSEDLYIGKTACQDILPWVIDRKKTESETRTALSNSRTKTRIVLQVVSNFWKPQRKTTHSVFHHRCTWNMVSLVPRLRKKLIAISYSRGVVHKKFVPQSQTINNNVYKGPLQLLHKSIWHCRPEHGNGYLYTKMRGRIWHYLSKISCQYINWPAAYAIFSRFVCLPFFFSFPLLKGALRGHRCA
jgi:hypothetical protein